MGSTFDSPRSWVPYEPIKDCSQGFCSIYCPQWCYIIFPPPPPAFDISDDSGSSSSAFSPLVIAIIGILASSLLLVSYYTVISKYCGSFESLRRHLNGGNGGDGDSGGDQLRRSEAWRMTVSEGLEESVIRSIAVCKYKKGDGFVDGTDCSVCLAEFREDETLRLLPKCSHAFHVQCIDTWLKSHSNCPLCRSVVVSPATALPAELPPTNPPSQEEMSRTQVAIETVITMEDAERGTQEENRGFSKQPRRVPGELGHTAIGIGDEMFPPIRRSEVCRDRISIANVLEISLEEEGRSIRVVSSGDEAAGSSSSSSSSSSAPMKKQ